MNRRDLLKGSAPMGASLLATAAPAFAQQGSSPPTVLVAYHSVTGNTEKMAQGVAEGARTAGATVNLKRVGNVTADDLVTADAITVGSPVYFANMAGEVKMFLDKMVREVQPDPREPKLRNKVGAAFATGASISNGKETTMLSILQAMLVIQMIVVSGGGAFGASATTGPDSPGIDDKELATARDLGKRVAEIAVVIKRGSAT